LAWSSETGLHGYFKGTTVCLSALCTAGRNEELLDLLEQAPYKTWAYRQWGVKALYALGKKAEALQYAEDSCGNNESPFGIARVCEEILLADGLVDKAYRLYAIEANRRATHQATFRRLPKNTRIRSHGTFSTIWPQVLQERKGNGLLRQNRQDSTRKRLNWPTLPL
jgi:hypothetical protein